jgi:branched-chain amino acid transport system ATP-binding protein
MSDPLLRVEGLNAFYAGAQILRDVAFEMGHEPVAVIGRNGMGKTPSWGSRPRARVAP